MSLSPLVEPSLESPLIPYVLVSICSIVLSLTEIINIDMRIHDFNRFFPPLSLIIGIGHLLYVCLFSHSLNINTQLRNHLILGNELMRTKLRALNSVLEGILILMLLSKGLAGIASLFYFTVPESLFRAYLSMCMIFLPFIWLLAVSNIILRVVFNV